MRGLVLVGFSLVAIPLIGAIINSVIQVDSLALQSKRLVVNGVQVTRESENLARQLASVERAARQYHVLGDDEMLSLYRTRLEQLNKTVAALRRLMPTDQEHARLDRIGHEMQRVTATLQDFSPKSSEVSKALKRFDPLGRLVNELTRKRKSLIDDAVNNLQASASQARNTLIWFAAILIPSAVLLIFRFTVLITRPVRHLSGAIHQLGDGRFQHPVAITGPPEFEALAKDLDWLRKRLLEVEEEKTRFLRHMSHELKTPLASLREGTELLVDGDLGRLSESQQEVAVILREHSIELQRLIENLIDFNVWQERKTELKCVWFELSPLLDAIIDHLRLTLDTHGVKVNNKVGQLCIYANREMIRKALENLLSNAVKFSPDEGSIVVEASRQGEAVQIDIADSGPGIPEPEREAIFQPFFQGQKQPSGHVGGTGIGLSLVKEVVEAHGGRIEIIDGVYQGAHFRLTLPIYPGNRENELDNESRFLAHNSSESQNIYHMHNGPMDANRDAVSLHPSTPHR